MILKIDDKLGKNKYIIDSESHISIDEDICKDCVDMPCIVGCPAECFKQSADGKMIYAYEGCLECGSCRIICPRGSIKWMLPRGGFGICYEFG